MFRQELLGSLVVCCLSHLASGPWAHVSVKGSMSSAAWKEAVSHATVEQTGAVRPHLTSGVSLVSICCLLGSSFPGGASGKEPINRCRRCRRLKFDPWVGKIPWRRAWQPTPVFLPGEPHGQRSLVGYSLWGHKELDVTADT